VKLPFFFEAARSAWDRDLRRDRAAPNGFGGLGQRPYSASVRSLPEWAETGWPRALSGTGRDRHACVTVLAVV